jgi:PPOX class probable FMN-dependent enzyme
MNIDSLAALRQLFPEPKERAVRTQIAHLDGHCRKFISLSPFLILATTDLAFNMDASPRGGEPGFVKVSDSGVLMIPDSPGNNRLDSFQNIVSTRKVGLLFLIPGVDETLRVNGSAVLSTAAADIAACTTERRAPRLVVLVSVEAAYLHCAKAFMRSKLWEPGSIDRRCRLPVRCSAIRRGFACPQKRRRRWPSAMRPISELMPVTAIEHVQLAMPPGMEEAARRFYRDLLGIPEIAKPPHLAKRGGAWFERGALKGAHRPPEGERRRDRRQ